MTRQTSLNEKTMKEWQLQDAKAHFSEVIKTVVNEGPQTVTLHGKPVVVLISVEEYQRLKEPQQDLISFIQNSPLKGIDLDIERSKSPTREIDL